MMMLNKTACRNQPLVGFGPNHPRQLTNHKVFRPFVAAAALLASATRKKRPQSDVIEHPTPRAQPVGEVLETLQAQAKDAMRGLFFEDGATTKMTPVTKRMRSEVGTVEVSAKRCDPNVQASVAIDVRCDRDEEGDAGRYQVRAEGHVGRESKEGLVEVPVSVEVHDADGGLKLDSDEMREEIANAIRATGVAPFEA